MHAFREDVKNNPKRNNALPKNKGHSILLDTWKIHVHDLIIITGDL